MLSSYLAEQTEQRISTTFGGNFLSSVLSLEKDQWQGPVSSGYGLHLVRVLNRVDSRIPDWSEVGARVISDMEFEIELACLDMAALAPEDRQDLRIETAMTRESKGGP